MLREVANIPMGLGDSLLLSGIGMLVVFMELVILALMIRVMSKVIGSVTGKSKEMKAAKTVDLVSSSSSFNIPFPIPYIFNWKSVTVSGNAAN